MRKAYSKILLLCIIAVAGCTPQKLIQTDLYFGLSQPNRNIISDSSWNMFVQNNVSKIFSDGFTVIVSEGKWVDENDHKMYSEPSRLIISINKMNKQLSKNIDSLRSTYKNLFQQQAVLRTDKKVKAGFN